MEQKLCCSGLRCSSSSFAAEIRLHLHLHLQQQQQHHQHRCRRSGWKCNLKESNKTSRRPPPKIEAESGGGKMVVELVGAFNQLNENTSSSSSKLLFEALKLSLPLLRSLPLSADGRSPLSKALSVALLLADHLHMDAEVISAALLRPALDAASISLSLVSLRLGPPTAHLLHDSLRLSSSTLLFDDPDSASAVRRFCLSFYDARAVVLELALMLDTMRHLHHLPRYHQQMLALRVLHIHAPLAHAILGSHSLSLHLEDLSFRFLFPYSYLYLDAWLRSHHNPHSSPSNSIDFYRERLLHSLNSDPVLASMVSAISVKGRYKSRYSTMKKLLRDGRKPEEVYDVLGLRVILEPRCTTSGQAQEADELLGERACYRAREIIQSLWKEVPRRTKDYIAKPKPNGYRSLHMAVDVSDDGDGGTRPLMEIQIRTSDMDALADGGTASHSLYKGGLTHPEEAKRLKAIMMAAAELAALRLEDFSSPNHKGMEIDQRDRVFHLLDKNGDGRISIEELMEVMEELGAPREDAREMMQLLDSNEDGSLSSDEFDLFQKQVNSSLLMKSQ